MGFRGSLEMERECEVFNMELYERFGEVNKKQYGIEEVAMHGPLIGSRSCK